MTRDMLAAMILPSDVGTDTFTLFAIDATDDVTSIEMLRQDPPGAVEGRYNRRSRKAKIELKSTEFDDVARRAQKCALLIVFDDDETGEGASPIMTHQVFNCESIKNAIRAAEDSSLRELAEREFNSLLAGEKDLLEKRTALSVQAHNFSALLKKFIPYASMIDERMGKTAR